MTSPIVGTWSYRSFLNNADLDLEFNNLRFGAGTLEITEPERGIVAGSLGGTGWSLGLQGWLSSGNPGTIRFQGSGDIGGEHWVYDYLGFLSPHWPNGVDQVPSIVGTIVRTAPHSNGNAPAGFVASWYAVKQ
ncbi:hypothetical protein [Anderseniella sp. Alg231-50]|uniref:hypothetical protein n=1 Tax=Anderseniella sp. Alg231-50 TaxID=1922226 RepID=UPI000D5505C2